MKLWDVKLQVSEKHTFTHLPSCILVSFSKNSSRLLLLKGLWKYASTLYFSKYKWKEVLLVIYLFKDNSSKSTFFMLNGIWRFLGERFLSNKLEFFISCNAKITRTCFFFAQRVWVLKCTFFSKPNCSP